MLAKCKVCNKIFTQRNNRNVYCSKKCRIKNDYIVNRERYLKYYQDNKKRLKEYKKEYTLRNPNYQKEYVLKNKNKINEKRREYYHKKTKHDVKRKMYISNYLTKYRNENTVWCGGKWYNKRTCNEDIKLVVEGLIQSRKFKILLKEMDNG